MELAASILEIINRGEYLARVKLAQSCYCGTREELANEVQASLFGHSPKTTSPTSPPGILARYQHFEEEAEEICLRLIQDRSVQVREAALMRTRRYSTRIITRRDPKLFYATADRAFNCYGEQIDISLPRLAKAMGAWKKLTDTDQKRLVAEARSETHQREGPLMETALTTKVYRQVSLQEKRMLAAPVAGALVSYLAEFQALDREQKAQEAVLAAEVLQVHNSRKVAEAALSALQAELSQKEQALNQQILAGRAAVWHQYQAEEAKWMEKIVDHIEKGVVPLDQNGLPHSLSGPILETPEAKVYALHGVIVDPRLFAPRPARESRKAAAERLAVFSKTLSDLEDRAHGNAQKHQDEFRIPPETAAWLMYQLTGRDLQELFTTSEAEARARRFIGLEFDL